MEPQLSMDHAVEYSTVDANDDDMKDVDFICEVYPALVNIYPFQLQESVTSHARQPFLLGSSNQITQANICRALSCGGVHHHRHHVDLFTALRGEVERVLADEEYVKSCKEGSSTRRLLKVYVNFIRVYEWNFGESESECRFVPTARSAIDGLEDVEVEGSDEVCSVCLEGFDEEEMGKKMPCEHKFHEECIVQWLERSHFCPLCRFEMPLLHLLYTVGCHRRISLIGHKELRPLPFVRMMARSRFASLTTFHRLFLEAGSSPVLGSSM